MLVSNTSSPSGKATRRISHAAIRRQCKRLKQINQRLAFQFELERNCVQQLKQRLADSTAQLELAQAELAQTILNHETAPQPFGNERPLPGHQFCVSLIVMAIALGKRVGFRAAADVLQIMFDSLKIPLAVPSHDAIEQWSLRLGVANLRQPFTPEDRVLWMVDHSTQIDQDKLLVIIGIRLADLPPPGKTLSLEKMKVLAVVPGQSWKQADVLREYQQLAAHIGAPVYVLCDGAVELREPAEMLQKDGKNTVVLGDLKHVAANLLEKQIGRGERFASFMSQVGLTRSRVQQTELSHLSPPSLRQKSRFMNLGPLLQWAEMTLHHLNDSQSESRYGVTQERLDEKFGWLREYAADLAEWSRCQQVIDRTLHVINHEGLTSDTENLLTNKLEIFLLGEQAMLTPSKNLAEQLVAFVGNAAAKLHAGERAWLSTEILESLFGQFKQMERQHSKGGFTRLIAAIPILCGRVTCESVRAGFQRVSSKDVTAWIAQRFGCTRNAKRNHAYREFRQCQRTKKRNPNAPTA